MDSKISWERGGSGEGMKFVGMIMCFILVVYNLLARFERRVGRRE